MANKEQAESFKAQGNKEFSAKNYDAAVKLYSKAIQLDPSNHVYYSNRSAAYAGLGQLDKSLEDGDKCIQLNKSWAKGYFRKGNALIEMKRYDEGVAVYKEGLKQEPNNAELRQKLAEAEDLRKKFKPKVNADGTPFSPAQLAKEEGNEFFKLGNMDKALEMYAKALSMAKEDDRDLRAAIYANRALIWHQLYNHNEVVKDCTEALKLQPQNVKALVRRALAYEALERFQHALDDFRAVLLLEPNLPSAQQGAHRISTAIAKQKTFK